eukprot:4809123-Amphidinium_carterae.1
MDPPTAPSELRFADDGLRLCGHAKVHHNANSAACASVALTSSASTGGAVAGYDCIDTGIPCRGAGCSAFACADYSDSGHAYTGSGDVPMHADYSDH